MGPSLVMGAVTAALLEFGAIRAGELPRYHVGLTQGDTVWLDAFQPDGSFFHAKVAEYVTLGEEARVYGEAYGVYQQFMPMPVGYTVKDRWEIFVTEGIEHRPLSGDPLGRSTRSRSVRKELCRFFAMAAPARMSASPGHVHNALLQRLQATFTETPHSALVDFWCSRESRRKLEALGAVPQHGDFVVNNIGARNSQLVVYDWEDFGKVALPGFDLCTLAISLVHEVTPRDGFARNGVYGEQLRLFLEPACAATGIDVDRFWQLVPLYLLTFLHLKKGYAAGVQTRIEELLKRYSTPVDTGLGTLAAA
jgi:hypothetical protein